VSDPTGEFDADLAVPQGERLEGQFARSILQGLRALPPVGPAPTCNFVDRVFSLRDLQASRTTLHAA